MVEVLLVPVPYPVVGAPGVTRMWGPVCLEHPRATDKATDVTHKSAAEFARALACAHPDHQRHASDVV